MLLKRLEQQARKRFGQNFLVSDSALAQIVSLAKVDAESRVVEIGPGLGALSQQLLETGAHVRAVELDRDLVGFLRTEIPELDVYRHSAFRWVPSFPSPCADVSG